MGLWWIDAQAWSQELTRRVQHYGYKYDYRKRALDAGMVPAGRLARGRRVSVTLRTVIAR